MKKLEKIFTSMVENHDTFGAFWKNLPLGREAFALMTDEMPLRLKGELTPYTRIILLNNMLSCMPERDCARFMKKVRDYQMSLFPLIGPEDIEEDMDIDGYTGDPDKYVHAYTPDDLKKAAKRTDDYLNPKITMEQWCDTYGVILRFDPVERSEKWEKCIYDVEAECDRKLKGEPRRMGFCYSYWSTKKAVLAKHGIDWSSPSAMNPHVMFD
ncbi:MAG: hypothetical protein MJY49_04510 [Bacteroidales bacterium]|nr:hypothetical protein [Bacteroidales bacterium]